MIEANDFQKKLGQKIARYLNERDVTMTTLAKVLGVTRQTVSQWCSGKTCPRMDKVDKMCEYFGVTRSDLMGDPVPGNAIEVPPQRKLPIVGTVSAGNGVFADSDIQGYSYADAKFSPFEHFYLRVSGDSMSPMIEDGDIVLVRKQKSVDSGALAVVVVDDDVSDDGLVKKVSYTYDSITLTSVNPYYPPRVYKGAEVQKVSVVGIVLELKRMFNK